MSDNVTFAPIVGLEEIEQASKLAGAIWTEHYAGIISDEQIGYMVDKFQSSTAIQEQLANGYEYYWMLYEGKKVGYFAIKAEAGLLFLSKIYLDKAYRGKRIASRAFAYLKQLCKERKLSKIWLTVNRNNATSIAVYQKVGFVVDREQVADIGRGFVMDDYIMELAV